MWIFHFSLSAWWRFALARTIGSSCLCVCCVLRVYAIRAKRQLSNCTDSRATQFSFAGERIWYRERESQRGDIAELWSRYFVQTTRKTRKNSDVFQFGEMEQKCPGILVKKSMFALIYSKMILQYCTGRFHITKKKIQKIFELLEIFGTYVDIVN